MNWQTARSRQGGFSLIELSVSMIIIGIIGLLAWRWITAAQAPVTAQDRQRLLNEAQAAIEGFVLSHNRLPCPALNTTGDEACGTASAVALPWRALGLSSDYALLHYGVNRGGGADLAVAPAASIAPDLAQDFVGVPVMAVADTAAPATKAAATTLQTLITEAQGRRSSVNGLDWCRGLRRFAANPSASGALRAGNASNDMPVAYVVVHPGQNGSFDGNNRVGFSSTWRFDFPGRAQDVSYDDVSLAAGPTDLASRIGCVTRLSSAQAAAQGAYAAYDNTRLVQQYWALRNFAVTQAEKDVDGAETGVTMAGVGVALTATGAAVGLASAANTEGLTVFATVMQVANIAVAATEMALAVTDLDDARQALIDEKAKLVAISAYMVTIFNTLGDALAASILLDKKGLNP